MLKRILILSVLVAVLTFVSGCIQGGGDVQDNFDLDGLNVQWLGHASFRVKTSDKTIYIDPYVLKHDEKADLILITHDHYDHCDLNNVRKLTKQGTVIITTPKCAVKLSGVGADVHELEPGQIAKIQGIDIKATHAYNIGKQYHPKQAKGLGFVISVNEKKIYHAGDTDKIPEMDTLALEGIDIALLPIGGTYTMDVYEVAEAAKTIKPKIVVPMHYNYIQGTETDPTKLTGLLEGTEIEVKIL